MQPSQPRLTAPSLAGAVDLSALRRASTAPPSQPAGDQQSPFIIDVTEQTFEAEVIDRSRTIPVVIDFWADWCEPCKQLTPMLEKLVVEGNGSWVLARIDVDANPRLAAAFRVQSIPMVAAIVGAQPVDAFLGVIPEAQLRQWVEALLKAAGGTPPVQPLDSRLVEADEKLAAGDLDGAETAYKELLADIPGSHDAASGLAQIELLRRLEDLDLATTVAEADAAPGDVAAQLRAADVQFATGEADRAFARLIDIIRRASDEEREAARRHLLALFAIAAPDDPVVIKARRDLASVLF